MDSRHEECDLNAVDEDFRKTVEFLVDLFMHDAVADSILNEYHGSVPYLAAEMREKHFRRSIGAQKSIKFFSKTN